jgi:D-alanyl-D-alanine dipeptidase
MKIQKLIDRSKQPFEEDPKKLPCLHSNEPYVRMHATPRLVLQPIWENPAGSVGEGSLYQEYIALNPGYNAIFLRQEVARRLYDAADSLPSYLQIVLRAGHRPLAVQRNVLNGAVEQYLSKNGPASSEDALQYARIFVDDPAIKIPSHVCGSAVDVELFNSDTGRLLDCGVPINTESERSHIGTKGIDTLQHENRMHLLTAMLQAGFAPKYSEWWHFSYGDRVWAYFYGEPQFLYDIQEPIL